MTRGPIPEMPGFGDYLVTSGILTRERLRAAQAYQRSMKVQLSTAIVTLGLATRDLSPAERKQIETAGRRRADIQTVTHQSSPKLCVVAAG